ncbi:Crp/Fnr family transcriptional regulator [Saccharothrix sp. Mg75]|uniref:Crp/Fnr family transcriptional regulator n=1 Tax=Saccharothrix sp. Mg75 TaxID=3445357 RepID=UPI003EEF30AD
MSSFLGQLNDHQRSELYRSGTKVKYRPGDYLMREGERGDYVLLIDRGGVQVTKNDAGGTEQVLNFCREGDLLGEIACVRPGGRRSASVIAQEVVAAIRVTRDVFIDFLNRHPALWLRIVERMAGLLVRAEGQVDKKADRVLLALLSQAEQQSGGARSAEVRLTQALLAKVAHVSFPTAQRVLGGLKAANLAYSLHGRIVVPCVPCLRAAAAADSSSRQNYGFDIIGCSTIGDCPRG